MGVLDFIFKRKLNSEIEEFLDWGKIRYPVISSVGGSALKEFARLTNKRSVFEVTKSDVEGYLSGIGSTYFRQKAERCFREFLKFHHVDTEVEGTSPYVIISDMKKASVLTPEALEFFSKKGSEGGKKTLQEHGKAHFRRLSALGKKARWGKKKLSTSRGSTKKTAVVV